MEPTSILKRQFPKAVMLASFIIIFSGVMLSESLVKPMLMALFVGIICAQPVNWLQNRKVPKALAITIVLVGSVSIFIGFGTLIANSLYSFSEDLPKYVINLDEMSRSVLDFFENKGFAIESEKFYEAFAPSKVLGMTQSILGQVGATMGNIFTVFFLVVFLLMEVDSIPTKITAIFKGPHDSLSYLRDIGHNVRHYLSIKTILSMLTGLLVWISLAIFGIDYAIIWALLAFLLNYIPNVGSIIAAIPAILFASVQMGLDGALFTAIVFVVVNMVIGNVIEPRVMGKGLGLSTFVVFCSLLFWGFLLGTIGMFLSVPLTMTFKIILAHNEQTKWIAILLGTEEEAQHIIDENKV